MIYDIKSQQFRNFLVAYAAHKHAEARKRAGMETGPAPAHVPKPTGPTGSV